MKKVIILFLFLGLLNFSCKKKEIVIPEPQLEGIFGTWTLVEYTSGGNGLPPTPEQSGYPSIEITRTGIFKRFENNKLVSKKSFEFANSIPGHSFPYQMKIKNEFTYYIDLNKDTLVLRPTITDTGSGIYIRKK